MATKQDTGTPVRDKFGQGEICEAATNQQGNQARDKHAGLRKTNRAKY